MRTSLFLAFLATANAVLVPNPTGPYGVSLRVHALTDNSRIDPYSPKTDRHKRKLVTSVFWPVEASACKSKKVAYMPPATAGFYGQEAAALGLSADTFADFRVQVCDVVKQKECASQQKRGYPLAIFSPAGGRSRLLYTAMAKSLASEGYVVVTVDHPYDADLVEFPDGTVIESINIPDDQTSQLIELVDVRTKDVAFVLSQLKTASPKSSFRKGLPGKIDFDRVVVYGHSIGGATAASVMLSDLSIRAGVDLDGGLFDPALTKGLSKPFFLLGRPNHSSEDATWPVFWSHLRGPKVEAAIAGTVHGTFTDVPLLISTLGLPDAAKEQLADTIGTIDAVRMEKVLTKLLVSFFGSVFKGEPKGVLATAKKFSDVTVVESKF